MTPTSINDANNSGCLIYSRHFFILNGWKVLYFYEKNKKQGWDGATCESILYLCNIKKGGEQ